MTIAERVVGNVTILDLEGKLTLGDGAPEFRKAVDALVADHDDVPVAVDPDGIAEVAVVEVLGSAPRSVVRDGPRGRVAVER